MTQGLGLACLLRLDLPAQVLESLDLDSVKLAFDSSPTRSSLTSISMHLSLMESVVTQSSPSIVSSTFFPQKLKCYLLAQKSCIIMPGKAPAEDRHAASSQFFPGFIESMW